ncbi:MAG: hypothetical protein H7339_12260 [Arcicella sp.]|nr:hypothetical protein [Arcicella sp.]
MLRIILYFQFLIMPLCIKGQVMKVDNFTEKVALQKIVLVYKDVNQVLTINQILQPNSIAFKKIQYLNIGITYADYWLKFELKNVTNNEIKLFLAFESVVNDSIFLYKIANQKIIKTTLLGENLPFLGRKTKHRNPIFEIILQPNEKAQYYLKAVSDGQPMNLTAELLNNQEFHYWDVRKMFFLGIVYGIMALILILNFSFYLITNEKIYIIFSLQVAFSLLCISYFDGFIYQYIFPNNGYWSSQTIAIGIGSTFLCSNRFTTDFFNLKKLVPWAYQTFRYFTYLIFALLLFSFLHPLGFNIFIASMTALTSLVALLLFVSILAVKHRGFASYFFGLLATVCLIIFGTFFQLFLIGLVPGIFLTHYAMHLAIVSQSVFLALAVNDKFRIIREENIYFQVKLVEALNQYSQNLISNIESERQRLAGEIHDGLGQNLLVIRNRILLTLKKKNSSEKLEETLRMLLDITSDTLDDTRAMSHNLRPPILNTMGLTSAIKSLVEKNRSTSQLQIDFEMNDSVDGLIPKDLEINLYRILQESFNNTLKHSQATIIELRLNHTQDTIHLEFKDNGVGYDPKLQLQGQGILGMKERVSLLKGVITIESIIGKSTKINIQIPIQKL